MDHVDRISRALSFIEENITNELSLEEIALRANCSRFWFHRVFTAVVGESLGSYIRKRRLNKAAEELVNTQSKILDIAIKYCFESHEAFTRSFIEHFGITPKNYRKSKLLALRKMATTKQILRSERIVRRNILQTEKVLSNGIRIIELPACKMISSIGFDLKEFDSWWSTVDKLRKDTFFPRDFMYYDASQKKLIWLYAHYDVDNYDGKYQIIDFPGGLYAASISKDGDDIDGERVYFQIKKWIADTAYFSIDERPERPHLFHVITSDTAFSKMKYRQLDIYVPIK